jgi:hypothetical protein
MFLACQQSKVTINLIFFKLIWKDAVETAKIAVDRCYVLRQFLTPLPSIDFREIQGLFRRYFWSVNSSPKSGGKMAEIEELLDLDFKSNPFLLFLLRG